MELKLFSDQYRDKRVLITGHTGFKGSWLALWLQKLGAEIIGFSLPSAAGGEFSKTSKNFDHLQAEYVDIRGDIRDKNQISDVIQNYAPDIIFHFAAQSLVGKAEQRPLETWEVNLLGTLNLLSALQKNRSTAAIVIATTDKVYKPHEPPKAHIETDNLGGVENYSSSKVAVEELVESIQGINSNKEKFFNIATVRSGNVIGGGDLADDRLFPDIFRSLQARDTLKIRNASAVRPWQHVLDSLSGYLLIGQELINNPAAIRGPWNIGPDLKDQLTVEDVLVLAKKQLPALTYELEACRIFYETNVLKLDSTKIRKTLGWEPNWSVDTAVQQTIEWYKNALDSRSTISSMQLNTYVQHAKANKRIWVE
jgi:CDP-glucose 4,6-dehydratase